MCLATPVKTKKKLDKNHFVLEDGKVVDTTLVPDTEVGDWLLCHANLAINKLDAQDAKDILKISKSCYN